MRSILSASIAAAAMAQGFGPIKALPGYAGTNTMYSGYITVDANAGRALYFWFVESSNSPATDPVVFWTNGGPGCSSLSGGLFSEHGPFRPNLSGGLDVNPYGWNTVANMLYVEQPAGVGFSYSNTTADYTVGDARAAEDVYQFLQGWLAAFPQYRASPLWITGESYGGHYTVKIAEAIVTHNAAGGADPKIAFAGIQVGNAWTNAGFDNTGAVDMWYGHGMIAKDVHDGVLATCNMSDVGPLLARHAEAREVAGLTLRPHPTLGFISKDPVRNAATGRMELPALNGLTCDDYTNAAEGCLGNTDIYDIYSDVCTATDRAATLQQLRRNKRQQNATTIALSALPDSNGPAGCALSYNPCVDTLTSAYLNSPAVQLAIHVVPSLVPGGSWVGCTGAVDYSRFDLLTSMLPVWQFLLSASPSSRYLVYSGDVDGIVPFTGTREWMAALGLPVTTAYHPYNTPAGQVAGWAYALGGPNNSTLHYASVRNAGHLVPTLQASRALQMFSTFLAGGEL